MKIIAFCTFYAIYFVKVIFCDEENPHSKCCRNFTIALDCLSVEYCTQTYWRKLDTDTLRQELEQLLTYKVQDTINLFMTCENETRYFRYGTDENQLNIEDLPNMLVRITGNIADSRNPFHRRNVYDKDFLDQLWLLMNSRINAVKVCYLLGFWPTRLELTDVAQSRSASNIENECRMSLYEQCSNLKMSKKCNSTTRCIESVWPFQKYKEDNDDICTVCKDLMIESRDKWLLHNTLNLDLAEIFAHSCVIPIWEVRPECTSLESEHELELEALLKSNLEPLHICTIAELCNNPRIDGILRANPHRMTEYFHEKCTNCTLAFELMRDSFRNGWATKASVYFVQLCHKLTNLDDCPGLINELFDQLASLLFTMEPIPACHLTGMCAYRYHLHDSIVYANLQKREHKLLVEKTPDLNCELCMQLALQIKTIFTADVTEKEFAAMVPGLCVQMGKNGCLSQQEYSRIYTFLQTLSSRNFCHELNLCSLT